MSKWGRVDYRQLIKLQKRMQEFEFKNKDKFIISCSKDLAKRLIRAAIKRTPVVSGDLRRQWNTDNVRLEVVQEGDTFIVTVINSLLYASYVEFGHRQTVGRFVPAIGKKLVQPWVMGRFMLTKSEVELQAKAPAILQKRLEKEMRKIFDD